MQIKVVPTAAMVRWLLGFSELLKGYADYSLIWVKVEKAVHITPKTFN